MGDKKFHVRFFKQDLELARVNQQLNEKNIGVADIDDPRVSAYQWRRRNCEDTLNASKEMMFIPPL